MLNKNNINRVKKFGKGDKVDPNGSGQKRKGVDSDKLGWLDEVMEGIQGIGKTFGAQQSTTDSNVTKGIDYAVDGIANVIPNEGIGFGIKTIAALGDIAQGLYGKTDQKTTADKILDSSIFGSLGIINNYFGKESDKFNVDLATQSKIGSSYTGTYLGFEDTKELEGKYGLVSSKQRKEANKAIAEANKLQGKMQSIAKKAETQQLAASTMGEQTALAYSRMVDGGYDQKYTYAAKKGGVLEHEIIDWEVPAQIIEWELPTIIEWELPTFKEGGNVKFSEELDWVPTLQKGKKVRTIEELIEYAKKENPRFIQRMSEPLRYIRINTKEADGSQSWRHATHEMIYRGNEVFPMIQEVEGKLHMFNTEDDAYNNAKKNNNIITFDSENEARLFATSGEDKDGKLFGYKIGWPKFFKTSPVGIKEEYSINRFKEGGKTKDSSIPEIKETTQKNVIPEGALHKNKHHMEHTEGLTKKGIPVIDNDGEQQAEIEREEFTMTLELTKFIEDYYNKFYNSEYTKKEKDEFARIVGEKLVYEILENTDDRIGLIDSCKNGGSIKLKKSVDDILEEPQSVIIEETVVTIKEEDPIKKQIKEAIKEVLLELIIK